jgi:4,5-DOPA dioxygenase extradiol
MFTQPALFVSHGSPTIVISDSPARHFLAGLAGELDARPDAIIVISAHHDEPVISITSDRNPPTVHDFGGFPDELYQMRYPAPGSPDLALDIARRLEAAGIATRLDPNRGFDHGAWTPLILAWPDAVIPVVQISINSENSPEWHYQLGRALADFRSDNILVIGSGSMTHNLRAFFNGGYAEDATPLDWVGQFTEWVGKELIAGDIDAVLHAVDDAPSGKANHPTMDHILPLFVALGAGGEKPVATQIHASTSFGVLAMDAWRFD